MEKLRFKVIETASDTFAVVDVENKKTTLFQKKNNVTGVNNIEGQPEKILTGMYGYIAFEEHNFNDLESELRKLNNPLYKYDLDVELKNYCVVEG